jgi:hypothetical protein
LVLNQPVLMIQYFIGVDQLKKKDHTYKKKKVKNDFKFHGI